MNYDDIVIGAGVSGLTAAILLAQNGRKVAIIEKSAKIAPTIRGFVRNDIYFDTGFHYATLLGPEEPFTMLCERLGIMSQIEVREYGNAAGDYLYSINPEFKFQFKSKLHNLAQQLIEIFPEDREAILHFLQIIRNFLDSLNNAFFKMVMNPPDIFEYDNHSLAQYLKENFKSPLLQTLLSLYAILYGSLPEDTPLGYHAMVSGAYYDKSWRILNGGCAITQAFGKQLQKYDVSVFTNCSVDHIQINDNKAVKAVALKDSDLIECDNCIFTAHPRMLSSMLPEGAFRPVYQRRLQKLKDTTSAVVLYCESEKANLEADFHNIILVQRPFPDMFIMGEELADRPMFISRSVSDKYIGGLSIICPWFYKDVQQWGMSMTGRRDQSYYAWKKQVADAIISVVKKHCGDKLGNLKIVDIATPLTFRDYMNAPNGCLYGVQHRTVDMPLMPRTRVRGLYLSGQAIISAGVMGAMVAGFVSAAAITAEDYSRTMS
jgi:all-trans-retinol 13,14-reductase